MQMVQFECPRHWKPSVSSNFWVGWIPFSHYWPSGVIRIGLPLWRWKNWKIFITKVTSWDANGPERMALALKTLCLIQFLSWVNSLFPLLALWGNKNWPPSMKVKKLENLYDNIGLKGCKWSSLNTPGTENPLSHSILKLDESPFPIISPSGVIRIGLPV